MKSLMGYLILVMIPCLFSLTSFLFFWTFHWTKSKFFPLSYMKESRIEKILSFWMYNRKCWHKTFMNLLSTSKSPISWIFIILSPTPLLRLFLWKESSLLN